MTPDEFRSQLDQLGLTQGALVRLLRHLGDPAEPATIRRRVERWADGSAKVPGEAIALLTLFGRDRQQLGELVAATTKKTTTTANRPGKPVRERMNTN